MDSGEKNMMEYAIVVGNAHFNSLGIARSLGEKGIPVVFINSSDSHGAETSKYTLKTYHRTSSDNIEEIIDRVISDFGGKPVLYPCSDEDAVLIDEKYEYLKDKVYCPGCCGKISSFMDKEKMCRLALEAGFNVPDLCVVSVDEKGKKQAESFGLPCIFKPLKSTDGVKADITICRTKEERMTAVEKFWGSDSKYGKVLIQQFVEGQTDLSVDVSGYKLRGKRARFFAQVDKIREFPKDCGSATFFKVKAYSDVVDREAINNILESMDFEGIFDLDIKVVDSKPYFIEVNLRNGAVSYGYTVAGFNIPYMYFEEKLSGEFKHISVKEKIVMSERDDLSFVLSKQLSPFSWVKDVINTDAMMVLNKRDMLPFEKAYGKLPSILFRLLAKKTV